MQTTLRRIIFVALITSLSGLIGCGSSTPAVGHRTAGLKHAVDADTAYRLGRFGAAAQRYRQALVHLRAADDMPAVARALHNYGMAIKAGGRCAEAVRFLNESAELHKALKRHQERALNLLAVGECQHNLDQSDDAVTTLGEARKWALKAKDKALAAPKKKRARTKSIEPSDIPAGKVILPEGGGGSSAGDQIMIDMDEGADTESD